MENENNENVEQLYMDFLKAEVENYCNSDGFYEMYWDYNDIESLKESLPEMLEEYNGSDDFIDYMEQQLFESFMNGGWFPEDSLFEQIGLDAHDLDNQAVIDYYEQRLDNGELTDDLEQAGYNGVTYGIQNVLSGISIDVNTMIAPYNEQNYDMGSIISAFGSDYQIPDLDWLEPDYLDNGITYLVHQQGYKLMDLYDELYGTGPDSKLIKSIAKEINNNGAESMSGLTLCSTVSALDYGNLISLMHSGNGYVEFPTNTRVGIYNAWAGSGSVFEIELEKPFVVAISDIRSIEPDSVSNGGEYSVADVYGSGLSTGSGITLSQSAPELVQEDLEQVLNDVRAKYGSENE